MSSISATSTTNQTMLLDFLGNDRFRVQGGFDADGDGVKDGESLSGESGKVVDANALIQMLQAQGAVGLKATSTGFTTTDGMEITPATSDVVTNYNEPALPDVTGPMAEPDSVGARMTWMSEMEDAALMWLALSTLATLAMRDMKDGKMLRNALQQGKLAAKQGAIDATEAKIEAERAAATFNLVTSIVSAAVSIGASIYGSQEGASATQQAIGGSAQALGNLTSALGKFLNTTMGPEAEAKEKELQAKEQERMEEVQDQAIEDAKSGYEAAQEQFKLAMRILSEHMERQSQIVQKLTSA